MGRMCIMTSVGYCFHSGHLDSTPGLEHCCSSGVPETRLVWVLWVAIRQCHLHCIRGIHTMSWPHFVLLLPATWGWGELLTAYGTLFPGEMKTEWKYWSGKGEVKGFVSVIFWRKMLMRCSTPSLCVHRQEGSPPFRVRQPWEKGGSYGTYTSLTETSILCTVPRWSRAPNSVPFLSLVVSQAAVIKSCGQILFFLTAVRWWWPRSFGSLRKAYSFVFSMSGGRQ